MDTSLKTLEEALVIRRQIDSLKKRLSAILGGAAPIRTSPTRGRRYVSPATRARRSAAAKGRWAKVRGTTKPPTAKKKAALTPAGRRKLSESMKARWAEIYEAHHFGPGPGRLTFRRS